MHHPALLHKPNSHSYLCDRQLRVRTGASLFFSVTCKKGTLTFPLWKTFQDYFGALTRILIPEMIKNTFGISVEQTLELKNVWQMVYRWRKKVGHSFIQKIFLKISPYLAQIPRTSCNKHDVWEKCSLRIGLWWNLFLGYPSGSGCKESQQKRNPGSGYGSGDSWREWQPIPVFLPWESTDWTLQWATQRVGHD